MKTFRTPRPHDRAGVGGRRGALLTALLSVLALTACRDEPSDPPPPAATAEEGPPDMASVRFAPETGVELDAMTRTDEGIYIQDVREGRGAEAQIGSGVSVEYSAWLPDGTLFEQRPSADGFGLSEFVLGEDAPVAGLDVGIAGMRAGGIRRIVLPPEHGYGLVGRPAGVPTNAILVFEVRLLSVRNTAPD